MPPHSFTDIMTQQILLWLYRYCDSTDIVTQQISGLYRHHDPTDIRTVHKLWLYRYYDSPYVLTHHILLVVWYHGTDIMIEQISWLYFPPQGADASRQLHVLCNDSCHQVTSVTSTDLSGCQQDLDSPSDFKINQSENSFLLETASHDTRSANKNPLRYSCLCESLSRGQTSNSQHSS